MTLTVTDPFHEFQPIEKINPADVEATVETIHDGTATVFVVENSDEDTADVAEFHVSTDELPEDARRVNAAFDVRGVLDGGFELEFNAERTREIEEIAQEIVDEFYEEAIDLDGEDAQR